MADDIRVKRFWTETETYQLRGPRPNPLTPGEPIGEPELVNVDWVEYITRINDQGTPTASTIDRVRALDPVNLKIPPGMDGGEKEMFFRFRWEQIEPSYRAWKEGNALPEKGTPLAVWSGITAEQATVFKLAGIRSVEDIAGMTANDVLRVRLPNVAEIKRMAGLYLETSGIAQAAAREAAKDAQLAAMAERMEAMEALLQERNQEPIAAEGQDEIDGLRAALDAAGIPYHHKAGANKLRELLNAQAA